MAIIKVIGLIIGIVLLSLIGFYLICRYMTDKALFKAKPVPEGHMSCPFCGGSNLESVHSIKWFIACKDCGCCGRVGETREEALRYWDWRTGNE